ncbi:MAG: hypothetical protein M1817_005968 [Caeruleum heppii]|nr:MAG: hypothetical protein M1817_005968 [Caeruleum heppii]
MSQITQTACISFVVRHDTKQRVLDIPLANLIFHTGKDYSLIASSWKRQNSSSKWREEMRVDLSQLQVRLHTASSDDLLDQCDSMSEGHVELPLLPLTAARQITDGYGNIVRMLDSSPASHELEQAIADYFKDSSQEPRQIGVWALVIPRENVGRDGSGRIHSSAFGRSIVLHDEPDGHARRKPSLSDWESKMSDLIEQGARLHRVLSGGGGWGSKQGLLSLDPDSTYTTLRDGEHHTAFVVGDDVGEEERNALGEVAREGDLVQFYISSVSEDAATIRTPDDGSRGGKYDFPDSEVRASGIRSGNRRTQFVFGVIPSTVDLMRSDGLDNHAEDAGPVDVLEDIFGALCELGVGHTIRRSRSPNPKEPQHDDQGVSAFQTKLDVPFTKIVISR